MWQEGYAVVLCNGEVSDHERELRWVRGAALLVAADGGARHARAMGLVPGLVVGDLDSIGGEGLGQLPPGVEVLAYPRDKDETDTQLAIRHVIDKGFRKVVFLGALGGRFDHSLANVLLLKEAASLGVEGLIIAGPQEVRLLDAQMDGRLELHGRPGDLLSLIPISTAHGVTTRGLKYPLRSESLLVGSPRGISNEFLTDTVAVTCESGLLVVVYTGQGY